MIYTEQTMKAMRIAYDAHHGQLDKGGAPYINHPFHVAESMRTEDETVAALLHDIVEDTPVTFDDLLRAGFSAAAVDAVRLLTKSDDADYDAYIRAIKENPIARRVKISDLRHNMTLSRIGMTESTMTPSVRARREKYQHSYDFLTDTVVRHATIADLDAIARVEAECFPPAEAASRKSFARRLEHFADHFWLLFEEDRLVSFVNGMVTDHPTLSDDMYDDASMHNPAGAWQMIFGVNTVPDRRRSGLAARLLHLAIREACEQNRAGLVLTCKTHMLPYYAKFGFINEGPSASAHGGAEWYQMRLTL